MKERPILFSGPMVQALLAGRKTQTRRVLKHPEYYGCPTGDCPHSTQAQCNAAMNEPGTLTYCPYGVPGDRLWVKEKFGAFKGCGEVCSIVEATYVVLADGAQVRRDGTHKPGLPSYQPGAFWFKWRPSIHMPRWASRITLEVVSVRVERVQDISEADAIAEGVMPFTKDGVLKKWWACDPCDGPLKCTWQDLPSSPREAFLELFYGINERAPRDANPWVWVVEFRRITP